MKDTVLKREKGEGGSLKVRGGFMAAMDMPCGIMWDWAGAGPL